MKSKFRMSEECLKQFEMYAAASSVGRMAMGRLSSFERFIEQNDDWFEVLTELGHLRPSIRGASEFTLSLDNLPYFYEIDLGGSEVLATRIGQHREVEDSSSGSVLRLVRDERGEGV